MGNYPRVKLQKKCTGRGPDLDVSEIATKCQDPLVDLNQQASEILFLHQVQNPAVRGAGT